MRKGALIITLALGHGINDFIAGYFLGSLAQRNTEILQVSLALLLYNLIAFGGQYPVALLLERSGNPKRLMAIAYSLNVAVVALFPFSSNLSVILAGVASALYHVAGGTVCANENKAVNIALFSAPGVAGLITGGFLAYKGAAVSAWLLIITIGFLILLSGLPAGNYQYRKPGPVNRNNFSPEKHDLIMILLLTVISLRSMIWNVFQLVHENNFEWLIAIGIAAAIGKIAGGWLADKIGWKLYTILSLVTASPLLTFFKKDLLLFCTGVGLLQSGIPATTSLLIHSLHGKTERAIGLSFGMAIILGAVVFYTPAWSLLLNDVVMTGITVVMMMMMFFINNKKQDILSPG